MATALLVRLRPNGPVRFGPASGARDETEIVGHSDTLAAALTWAAGQTDSAAEWREASIEADAPAVRFSSLFPFSGRTLFVIPPRSIWPPAASARVRWKSARFVPVPLVAELLEGKPLQEERWEVDFHTGCVIASAAQAPFRVSQRRRAAQDRWTPSALAPHETACVEFPSNAGLWCVAVFRDAEAAARWRQPVEAAFRVLADSGIGGERSHGWGLASAPDFQAGEFPALVMPGWVDGPADDYWMLSMFSPGPEEPVDWTAGNYEAGTRSAVETLAVRMVEEGSVIRCAAAPVGRALNTASPQQKNPRWRSGIAVAVPLPKAKPPESAA